MSELLAGIDLGGTSIKAAIADVAGNVLIRESIPTESHAGPDTVIQRIAELVLRLQHQAENGGSSRLAGVGLGVPGLVDVKTGTTRFLPNLPTQWRDVPVADSLRAALGCPVRVLNDVRMATLGELRFGFGRERPKVTLAFFAIGTGIGGGVVIDGRLRLGEFGAAGELGHQIIVDNGPRCGCGNHGCLEALASGPAIAAEGVRLMNMGLAPRLREMVDGRADRVSPREMREAAEAGDEAVAESLERAARLIGIAAANIVTVLHPELIVLGGGVSRLGDVLLQPVRDVIKSRVKMLPTENVEVKCSQLGDQAGLMGAIALAQRSPSE